MVGNALILRTIAGIVSANGLFHAWTSVSKVMNTRKLDVISWSYYGVLDVVYFAVPCIRSSSHLQISSLLLKYFASDDSPKEFSFKKASQNSVHSKIDSIRNPFIQRSKILWKRDKKRRHFSSLDYRRLMDVDIWYRSDPKNGSKDRELASKGSLRRTLCPIHLTGIYTPRALRIRSIEINRRCLSNWRMTDIRLDVELDTLSW